MNPTTVVLVIASAVIHAFRNFYTKKANDPQIFIWWYELIGSVIFLPLFLYYLWQEGSGNLLGLTIGVISGLLHALYWMLHGRAYKGGDLSHVYPIMRSAPALVLVFAVIFLQEQVSFMGIMGILLVVFGVYIINMKRVTLKTLDEPITSIFKEKATLFAFLTLVSVAIYSIVDKIGVKYVNPVVFSYYFTFFGFVFVTPYIFYAGKSKLMKKEWKLNKKSILLNGFFATFGYLLILIALSTEKVSYVVGLRQLSVVVAVLLGSHILKEKHKLVRFTASAFIFLGAFLISIAD
ncbi:EamA family transporter [Candidatus Woesearchaeota archaeon]|nr:EamA family transporter [Candidatus Woesearchaeota archaeon]